MEDEPKTVSLQSLLVGYKIEKKKRRTSERAELLQRFIDRLNGDRRGTKYPLLKVPYLAFKLSHLKVKDLYFLYSSCQQSKNFSATFWWSLKPVDKLPCEED